MILLTQLLVPLDCIVTYDTVNSATGSSRLLPMILLTQLLVPLVVTYDTANSATGSSRLYCYL